MKKISTVFVLFFVAGTAFGQSKSYETLHHRFHGDEGVHSFSLGGIFLKAAVGIASSQDDLLRKSMRNVKHCRFMVIPHEAFAKQQVTVGGFQAYLKKDSFQEVMSVRDKGDIVTVFHRQEGNHDERYFVLIEEDRDVVAIELRGEMDLSVWKPDNQRISLNK